MDAQCRRCYAWKADGKLREGCGFALSDWIGWDGRGDEWRGEEPGMEAIWEIGDFDAGDGRDRSPMNRIPS